MERIVGVIALFVANLGAVFFAYEYTHHARVALPVAIATIVLGFAALALLFSDTVRIGLLRSTWIRRVGPVVKVAKRFITAVTAYRGHPDTLSLVTILSVLEVFVVGLALWMCARALGTSMGLEQVLIATPITLFLARIPLTIWGLGVTEGGFAAVMALLFNVPATEAVAASLASRVVEMCVAIPALVLWRRAGVSLTQPQASA
jgi:uncharacterized membrane protein YbhN (UPF0104 family)